MMITRRLAAFTAAAALAVTVTVVGGENGAPSALAAPPDSTPGSAPAESIAQRAIDPDGHLRYGYALGLAQWDPIFSTISQDNVYLSAVYDRLVHHSTAGELIPGLATEWSVTPDGLTWTFTLREGVVFHDDTPFDAAAVKANLERGQTTEGSTVAPELLSVTAIEVVDPTTVAITADVPMPQLPAVLSDRAGMMASPAAFETLAHDPVGAGMFALQDEIPESEATLVRNQTYWDPDAVQVATLTITAIPDPATRLNALRSGQIDWAALTPEDYEIALEDPNLTGAAFDSISYLSIATYKVRPPLDDVRVRQAISHAIDRPLAAEALLLGYATPCSQPFPPGYSAHVDELGCDRFGYDPERARELLAEAGYGDGLELSMQVAAGGDGSRQAEVIQAQLAEVGISLEVVTVDVTRFVAGFFIEGEYDLSLGLWGGRASAIQTLQILYASDGALNPGKLEVPEFDAALETARGTIDPDEQLAAIRAATTISVEQQYDIPLWFVPYLNAWNRDLVGVEGYLLGKQEFRGVGIAAD
ncbi:MAG: ABC transporter substrate-binding protein [Desertimonas sp.]